MTFITFVSALMKGLSDRLSVFFSFISHAHVQAWHHLCRDRAYKRSLLRFKHEEFFKCGWVLKCIGGLSKLNHIWNLKQLTLLVELQFFFLKLLKIVRCNALKNGNMHLMLFK